MCDAVPIRGGGSFVGRYDEELRNFSQFTLELGRKTSHAVLFLKKKVIKKGLFLPLHRLNFADMMYFLLELSDGRAQNWNGAGVESVASDQNRKFVSGVLKLTR